MDNITHVVAGLAVGELIHRSLPEESTSHSTGARRALLLVSCAVASNFPDLDLVLTPLLPQPLGYLLHHRGHTHTILYALPQALLLFALIWALWPSARKLLRTSATARRGFGLSVLIGFSLHMLMDYLNSYGIHPFHPFDSRWFYGDMVFIIEPFFWISLGVPMALMVRRRWLKGLWLALLIGAPMAFTFAGFLPWFSLLTLIATAIGVGRLQLSSGAKRSTALICSAMLAVVFVAVQSYSSSLARHVVKDALAAEDPASRFLDSAMSSYPTNPICWGFVSIEMNETANTYRLRRGLLSLAPGLMPVSQCPALLSEHAKQNVKSPSLAFSDEESGSLEHLRSLVKENCHFKAWMRFARAPVVSETQAFDMRFKTRGPRGNFTLFSFEDFKNQACSKWIPQWEFPRADMLENES